MTVFLQRLALITGAGRGIGKALAVAFAEQGATIIALSKTSGSLEALDDFFAKKNLPSPVLVPLDLCDGEAIDRLGASLYQRFGKLDILIGNAGWLGELSPITHIQPQHWQKIFDTNVTANYRLLRSLDPLLRRSDAARAVFITSQTTRITEPFWGSYAASKAALEKIILTYAKENKHVKANLIEPFQIATDLYKAAFPGKPPENTRSIDDIIAPFLYFCSPQCEDTGRHFIMAREKLP